MAAVLGVLLGWWLLSGKVKDLKGAVEESDKVLNAHRGSVDLILTEIRDKMAGLDAQFTTTAESLGQLRGAVGDLQSVSLPDDLNGGQPSHRETIRKAWEEIRDHIEMIAANPAIDGRTRARYGRVDRRSYATLVNALGRDDRLGGNEPAYKQALALWHQFRSGRREPSEADSQRMTMIRNELLPPA